MIIQIGIHFCFLNVGPVSSFSSRGYFTVSLFGFVNSWKIDIHQKLTPLHFLVRYITATLTIPNDSSFIL